MTPQDKDLLIEIRVSKEGNKIEVSTGYPVSRNLILTSLHGLIPTGFKMDAPIRIRWFHQPDPHRGFIELDRSAIVWKDETLDAALLRCDTFKINDWRYLSSLRPFHDERWSSEGFPFGADSERVREFSVSGRVHSAASHAHAFALSLDDSFKERLQNPDKQNLWGGISGAPVFVRGQIVGVIVETPTATEKRLTATLSSAFFNDEAFRKAIGYDRAAGRVSAARKVSASCLNDSEKARLCLRKALAIGSTEPVDLANSLIDLPTPEKIITVIDKAHTQAVSERDFATASVLRTLALIAVPARYDEVVVDSLRSEIDNSGQSAILFPLISTWLGAEFALAAVQDQPSKLKEVKPNERYPRGETDLEFNYPPNEGMGANDEAFMRDWNQHIINKFANTSETKNLKFSAQAKIALRRMVDEVQRSKRTYYVLLEDTGDDKDNALWDNRVSKIRETCPSLLFLRLSTDDDLAIAETELLDPLCRLLAISKETTP